MAFGWEESNRQKEFILQTFWLRIQEFVEKIHMKSLSTPPKINIEPENAWFRWFSSSRGVILRFQGCLLGFNFKFLQFLEALKFGGLTFLLFLLPEVREKDLSTSGLYVFFFFTRVAQPRTCNLLLWSTGKIFFMIVLITFRNEDWTSTSPQQINYPLLDLTWDWHLKAQLYCAFHISRSNRR